jgi:hypothetical protein
MRAQLGNILHFLEPLYVPLVCKASTALLGHLPAISLQFLARMEPNLVHQQLAYPALLEEQLFLAKRVSLVELDYIVLLAPASAASALMELNPQQGPHCANPALLVGWRFQARHAHYALQDHQALMVLVCAAAAQLGDFPILVGYVPLAFQGRYLTTSILHANSAPLVPLAALEKESAQNALLDLFHNNPNLLPDLQTTFPCVSPAPPTLLALLVALALYVPNSALLAQEHCFLPPA